MIGRRGEPRDFPINFVDGDGYFGVHLGARTEGGNQKQVAWKDLEDVAAQCENLTTRVDGSGDLKQLGERLFGYLFSGTDRDLFVRASYIARQEERPLRVLIQLARDSPLQKIPWEILHDGHDFLAKESHCSVVRYFFEPREASSLQVGPPLRILLTLASPRSKDPLNLEAEVEAVQKAYESHDKLVDVKVERAVSFKQLVNLWRGAELDSRPFHVWHHCGHGDLLQKDGVPRFRLALEGEGEADFLTVDEISEVIGMCPGLKLAILNVCHGGSLVGLAPELSRINVPVVVGFLSKIQFEVAHEFAAVLHECLLPLPVELAVSQARRALALRKGMELEWFKPLLFSRRKDSGTILRGEWKFKNTEASRRRKEKIRGLLRDLSNKLSEEGGQNEPRG